MSLLQKIAIAISLVLFLVLYLGFSTQKVQKVKQPASTEKTVVVTQDFEEIISVSKKNLTQQQNEQLRALEKLANDAEDVSEKNVLLKKIAGFWYRIGQVQASAVVAWQVAELEPSDSTWSVAAATFYEGIGKAIDEKTRNFCAEKSAEAFGKAAQINPSNIEHAVNQALVWAEVPPSDNPMKAALTLRTLAERHPDQPAPFNALGRLAIKTQQWEKAIERLEHSWTLQKSNSNTACMLALAYEKVGNLQKSKEFEKLCKQ